MRLLVYPYLIFEQISSIVTNLSLQTDRSGKDSRQTAARLPTGSPAVKRDNDTADKLALEIQRAGDGSDGHVLSHRQMEGTDPTDISAEIKPLKENNLKSRCRTRFFRQSVLYRHDLTESAKIA